MDQELMDGYIEDLRDNLIVLDDELIKLRKGSRGAALINNIFRVAHTIKGNSAAMDFMKIEKVMHTMEDILQAVRSHTRELSDEIIDVMYSCHDFLEDCVEAVVRDGSDQLVNIQSMLDKLARIGIHDQSASSPADNVDPQISTLETELFDLIKANYARGYSAHKVVVTFSPDCLMKTIQAWLVFEQIDNYAVIAYSYPPRPSEDDFRNPTYHLDEQKLRILVLCDKPLGEMETRIASLADIQDVVIETFTSLEEVKQCLAGISLELRVLQTLTDLQIMLLGENSPPEAAKVRSEIEAMARMVSLEEKPLLRSMIETLNTVLSQVINADTQITPAGAEALAALCRDLEVVVNNETRLDDDTNFISQVQVHMDQLTTLAILAEQRIGELLVSKGLLNDDDVEEILEIQRDEDTDMKFGQVAVKEGKVKAYDVIQALKEQVEPEKLKEQAPAVQTNEFVRVPVSKVDSLMDMLGELLILNAQLEVRAEQTMGSDNGMINTLSRTAKLIKEIQSLSMSLRMVEIRPTLHRLTRIARDTANELGKRVTVTIEGENTEIDRSATDKLFDPLMHLVRNAVSHGIEDEAGRIAAGKRPEGQISIKCYSKRGQVYIEIADDGQGMDAHKILAKAKQLAMADDRRDYSDEEILRFIFEPGFSTQDKINNISGRGVGMNVVQEEIRRMGGKVEIFNQPGLGCTFTLRIPMNLAVVNGTIVDLNCGRYILPTLFIKEFFVAEADNWVTMQGRREAIRVRDLVIPVLWADKLFGSEDSLNRADKMQVVILEMDQKLLAFPVSKIVSRQEIVSKPLIHELSNLGYASGLSILGDGTVALILDVEAMFRLSEVRVNRARATH